VGFLDDAKKKLGLGGTEAPESSVSSETAARQQEAADQAAAAQSGTGGVHQTAGEEAAVEQGTWAPPGPVGQVVVEEGDTLASIAAQFGVDENALVAANADTVTDPTHIRPGQVLRLP
jgi:resuscitation-promoting factor RpfA